MRKTTIGLVTAVAMATAMLIGIAAPAHAATAWFVRVGGNNANTCQGSTAATACATITGVTAKPTFAAGDTIDVGAGTFVERPSITKGVTITGAGAGTTILDGSNAGITMTLNIPVGQSFALTGMTISRGSTTFGGGMQILAGTISITNTTVTSSTAAAGAVAVFGTPAAPSNVTTNNLNITGNTGTAASLGAGLYVGGGTVTMTGGSIANNTSPSGAAQGGGVYMSKFNAGSTNPVLTTNNTAITGNILPTNAATLGGGVALAANATFTMNGGSLSSNTALNGGGLYVADDAVANLSGVTVNSNTATGTIANAGNGGAIYNSGALTVSNNSSFTGNRAIAASGFTGNGGSLAMLTSVAGKTPMANISNTTFTGGLAAGVFNAASGGAIATFTPSQLTMTSSTLTGNKASGTAGGLYASSSAAVGSVSGTSFSGNSSGFWGGGAVVGGTSATDLPVLNGSNNTFTGNTAIAGGAVAVFARGTYNSTGGSMAGNTSNLGGGIYIAGKASGAVPGAAAISGGTITNNVSDGAASPTTGNGGGIFNSGSLTISNNAQLSGNRVINSSAAGAVTGYGGGVFVGPSATGDAPAATISDTTIAGGTTPAGTKNANIGGGLAVTGDIFPKTGSNTGANTPAVVTLTNDTISANNANFAGGVVVTPNATLNSTDGAIDGNNAITAGGLWVYNLATATLLRTNITNNVATGTTANTGDAGGALNWGTLSITNATLAGNKALIGTASGTTGDGGALYLGGANLTTKTSLSGVTLSNNIAGNYGSAIITLGTGTTATDTTSIVNSTISGNQTTTGGWGAVTPFNPISIVNSTITNNTSPAGGSGGLYNFAAAAANVSGSILFGNSVSNCTTPPTDGGYNLTAAGDSSCGFTVAKNDVFADPQLGVLANNGGPTQTRLPGNSSPAINKIPSSTATGVTNPVTTTAITLCAPGGTDQRGNARPSGDLCDIGSVEVASTAPVLTGPASDTVTAGSAVSDTFTATGVPTPKLTKTGGLPTGVTFTDNGNGTATIAGTPAAGTGGSYPVTIKAANGASPDATLSFTLTVTEGPTLTGPSSDTYTVGTAGGPDTFVATSTPTATLTKTGALPSGVTFTDNGNGTATIAGTPAATTGGVYVVTVKASNGVGTDATKTFTLTVKEAPSISGATSLTYTAGTAIPAQTYTIVGYPAPTLTTTGLPSGLALTNNGNGTATLAGTPAAGSGGVHNAVFTVTNTVGVGTLNATITVNEAPQISGPTSRGCAVGTSCGPDTFSASGYPPSAFGYTGTLPTGITFTDNGNGTATIGGTAAAGSGGVYAITITATNAAGSAIYSYTLTIGQPPTVNGPANGVFVVGTPGAPLTYTTTGFPTPALSATDLPAGLTFTDNGDGTGALGGTAAAGTGGSYTAVVHATNGVGSEATMNVALVVNEAPGVSGPAARNCVVSNPCGPDTFTATGNPTPTLASFGSLPAGVSFTDNGNGTATIGGTPAANSGGTYSVSIVATNAYGTATTTYALTVGQPPTVTGPSSATYTVGSPGATLSYTTTGYPTPALSASGLPAGVALTDNGNGTASISGTAAAGTGGVHLVVINADNGVGAPATTGLTLTVNEAPQVTGPTTATYVVGFAGTPQTFTTTVGYPAAAMSEIGTLPVGIAFTDNGDGTATLSGTPAAHTGGIYPITVKAVNGSGTSIWAFTLTVNEAPTVSGPTSARFDIDSPGSVGFTTTGFPQAGLTLEGDLPSGVGFYDNADGTGTIAGTPDSGTEGVYLVTITADNGVSPSASMSFSLTVVAPVIVTTGDLTDAAVGTPYSQQLTATGGVPPYTWSIVGGALPPGLTLSPSGLISGSPTAPAATSTFTVRAQDSLTPAHAGTKLLTLVVRKGATTLTVAPAVLKISALQPTLLTVSATLTGPTKQPLPNQSITFFAGQTKICVAVTDATGKAGCSVVVKEISTVLHLGNRASYYGSQYWQPANGAGGVIG